MLERRGLAAGEERRGRGQRGERSEGERNESMVKKQTVAQNGGWNVLDPIADNVDHSVNKQRRYGPLYCMPLYRWDASQNTRMYE